jgi:flagellar secretion chaperone FliS
MNRLAAYQENAVATQTKEKLVVMLYDGAIKFLRQAIPAMEVGDVPTKNTLLQKAQAIIDELDGSLNMEAGGELAGNLRRLYDFLRRDLILANIRNDVKRIRDSIRILEDLNSGWKSIGG